MSFHSLRTSALSLALFIPGCGGESAPTLSLNLTAGDEYRYTLDIDQHIEQAVFGNKSTVDQLVAFTWTERVSNVAETGDYSIDLEYDSVRFRQLVEGAPEPLEYDSTVEGAPVPDTLAVYAGLIGKGYEMVVRRDGSTAAMNGIEEMVAAILEENEFAEGSTARGYAESFRSQFNAAAMTEMLDPIRSVYPQTPVEVGDRWSRRFVITAGFPQIQENVYELVERKDGKWRVGVTSRVSPIEEGKPMNLGMMMVHIRVAGTQVGELVYDETTGTVLSFAIQQDLAGEIAMDGGPENPDGSQIWPLLMSGKLRLDRIDG